MGYFVIFEDRNKNLDIIRSDKDSIHDAVEEVMKLVVSKYEETKESPNVYVVNKDFSRVEYVMTDKKAIVLQKRLTLDFLENVLCKMQSEESSQNPLIIGE